MRLKAGDGISYSVELRQVGTQYGSFFSYFLIPKTNMTGFLLDIPVASPFADSCSPMERIYLSSFTKDCV